MSNKDLTNKIFFKLKSIECDLVFKEIKAKDLKINTKTYLELIDMIKNQNGVVNEKSQKLYEKYWALGVIRPSTNLKKIYFNQLAILYTREVFNLKETIDHLKPNARNACLFSHTTKLFHTINQNLPIIDTKIINILKIRKISYKNSLTIQEQCEQIYESLSIAIKLAESNKLFDNLISEIELSIPSFKKLTYQKKIDTILTELF